MARNHARWVPTLALLIGLVGCDDPAPAAHDPAPAAHDEPPTVPTNPATPIEPVPDHPEPPAEPRPRTPTGGGVTNPLGRVQGTMRIVAIGETPVPADFPMTIAQASSGLVVRHPCGTVTTGVYGSGGGFELHSIEADGDGCDEAQQARVDALVEALGRARWLSGHEVVEFHDRDEAVVLTVAR